MSLSIASIIFWTTLFRYFAFRDLIIPWSMGCREGVVLGGKKKKKKDLNPTISGWASQLSTINTILCCSFSNFPSNSLAHSSKINLRIHPASLLSSISARKLLYSFEAAWFFADGKHRKLRLFMLAAAGPVKQILLCLPPAQFAFFKLRVSWDKDC